MNNTTKNPNDFDNFEEEKSCSDTPEEKVFFLLSKGQKEGPFSFVEIQKMLDEKKLLFGQLISENNGQNWRKISELSQFDCHKKKKPLPPLPEETSFFHSNNEAYFKLKEIHQKQEENFDQENLENNQKSQKTKTSTKNNDIPPLYQTPHRNYRPYFIVTALITFFLLVGILNYQYTQELPRSSHLRKPKKEKILRGLVRKKTFNKVAPSNKRKRPVIDNSEQALIKDVPAKKSRPHDRNSYSYDQDTANKENEDSYSDKGDNYNSYDYEELPSSKNAIMMEEVDDGSAQNAKLNETDITEYREGIPTQEEKLTQPRNIEEDGRDLPPSLQEEDFEDLPSE